MSSSTFLTACLLIFVSATKPSRTIIISIDRSEPKFESHAEGKFRKTERDGNFDVFCLFSAKSDPKLFHPDQENERHDI